MSEEYAEARRSDCTCMTHCESDYSEHNGSSI